MKEARTGMQIKKKLKDISVTVTREDGGKTIIVMKGHGFFGFVTNNFVPVNTDPTDGFQKLLRIGINHSNTLTDCSKSLHRLSYPGSKSTKQLIKTLRRFCLPSRM
jgi:hypothetical protein